MLFDSQITSGTLSVGIGEGAEGSRNFQVTFNTLSKLYAALFDVDVDSTKVKEFMEQSQNLGDPVRYQDLVRKAIQKSSLKDKIFVPNERDSIKDINVKRYLGEIYGKE